MDALEDFDFGEEARPTLHVPTSTGFGARPAFGRRVTADDGSALFGGLTSSFDDSDPPSPVVAPEDASSSSLSPPVSPSLQADLATSIAEPLGPGMSSSSHLAADGMVEAVSEVDGSKIRVPADDVSFVRRIVTLAPMLTRNHDRLSSRIGDRVLMEQSGPLCSLIPSLRRCYYIPEPLAMHARSRPAHNAALQQRSTA